ncbi:MAG: tetratricopeptide repeat protein [Bacteroidota bacterium]
MIRVFIPAILIFIANVCLAQGQQKEDSLKKLLATKDISGERQIQILNELGWSVSGSKSSEAVAYFYQALDKAIQTHDSTWQAVTLSDLGRLFSNSGQYEQSVHFFLDAIKIFDIKHDSSGIVKACTGIGGTFARLKDFDKAISYFDHALSYAPVDAERKGILHMNLGAAYFEKGDYDKSLVNFNRSRSYFEQVNDKGSIALLYNNLGVLYQKLGNFKEAIRYNRLSQQIATQLDDPFQVSMNMVNFGDFYLQNNVPDSALYYGRQALQLAEADHFPAQAYEAYRILSEASSKRGDFKNAYRYHIKYQVIKDSLINQQEQSLVQQLHEGYQLGKKESEIASLRIQQEKLSLDLQVNRLYVLLALVISVSLVIILGVITYNFFKKKKLAATLDRSNHEIQRLNQVLEIKALRSQIDPHFVFNALNGLQHFLSKHTPEESVTYLGKVSRLIRLTLQNASSDWIKISEEMEILRLYLQVEQYRFPGKFDFEFHVDEGLANEKIPFLVIQPYVENAVLHGLVPRNNEGGALSITFEKKINQLTVTVEDNGVGRKEDKAHSDPMFRSMGSGLVRERLKKLSLQMKMVMEVTIEDLKDIFGNPSGTRTTLTFELDQRLSY